ncbi:acyl-CoA-binding protein [Myroides sp. M-43]|uniref:acyl-CoA-binding protein n=1 Tax=Myroides oncorhynchi TaxID=2893756 RepID=UPI001E28B5AB|nr:acyl-CoA-binding protein [Myroides oncorhynchi]MCC9041357.1 acyl-CoA-binding protein [Myroides oncorhynchi]
MSNLELEFTQAYERISKEAKNLPQDVMLRIYAYYKQATNGLSHQDFEDMSSDLKRAFKFNAWTQVSHLSKDQAMLEYINLAKEILDNGKA